MKKILMVFMLVLIAFMAYGAGETGEGTCTVAPSSGTVLQFAGNLTFTATAKTTNMVNGVFVWKFDDDFAKTFGTMTSAGTAAEKGTPFKYTEGGYTYVWVTTTCAIDSTVLLYIPLGTFPDMAGVNTVEVLQAADSKDRKAAAAIASSPSITLATVAGWTSSAPSVDVQLNTFVGAYTLEINCDQALTTAYIQIDKPNSSWLPLSVATAEAGYCVVTGPVSMNTPAVASDGASMIIAVPTMAKNQKITISFPSREALTPAPTPLKNTYGIEQQWVVRAVNAIPTASATVMYGKAVATLAAVSPIPTVTGTPVGQYNIWVATPTIMAGVSGMSWDSMRLTFNAVAYNKSMGIFVNNTPVVTLPKNGTSATVPIVIGKNSVEVVERYVDYLNDGVDRYVSSTAMVIYSVGKYDKDLSPTQALAAGFINKDTVAGTAAAGYSAVTGYAEDRLVLPPKIYAPTGTNYEMYIGGTALGGGTLNGIGSAEVYGLGSISNDAGYFLLPSGTFMKISVTAGTSDAKRFYWETIKLNDLRLLGNPK